MPYTYSHQGDPWPETFLSWLQRKDYELEPDQIPGVPMATLENTETVDIYYYKRTDTELGLNEWSGVIALNDKGYVAKLGLRDRHFVVLQEASNVATDEDLVKWLDTHAILTPESPIYWNNEVLLSVLEEWAEQNSNHHKVTASIEEYWLEEWAFNDPPWEDPHYRQFFVPDRLVYLLIHREIPLNLWVTQFADGRFMVYNEQLKQVIMKNDYSAVEEYLDSLV
jgi:hypothetical protein